MYSFLNKDVKKYKLKNVYKINDIYHTLGKTNLYCSVIKKIDYERVKNELNQIKEMIDKFIEEELKVEE